MILKARLQEWVGDNPHRKAPSVGLSSPRSPASIWCQSCLLFLLPILIWRLSWRHRRARQRSSKTASILLSTQVIFPLPLWFREDSRRPLPISSLLPHTPHPPVCPEHPTL